MVWIDYVIIAIVTFSVLVSLMRGFVRETLSLIIWSCAFFVSSQFYPYLDSYLIYIDDQLFRNCIAIAILFIAILIIGAIVSYIMSSLVNKTGLSGTDRILGICFGLFRGILIVSAILLFLDTFTPLSKSVNWQHSELIPQFNYVIKWIFNYLKNTSSFLLENIIIFRYKE